MRRLALCLLALVLLAACTPETPMLSPLATPTPEPTATLTVTPLPTETATPQPTQTPMAVAPSDVVFRCWMDVNEDSTWQELEPGVGCQTALIAASGTGYGFTAQDRVGIAVGSVPSGEYHLLLFDFPNSRCVAPFSGMPETVILKADDMLIIPIRFFERSSCLP